MYVAVSALFTKAILLVVAEACSHRVPLNAWKVPFRLPTGQRWPVACTSNKVGDKCVAVCDSGIEQGAAATCVERDFFESVSYFEWEMSDGRGKCNGTVSWHVSTLYWLQPVHVGTCRIDSVKPVHPTLTGVSSHVCFAVLFTTVQQRDIPCQGYL